MFKHNKYLKGWVFTSLKLNLIFPTENLQRPGSTKDRHTNSIVQIRAHKTHEAVSWSRLTNTPLSLVIAGARVSGAIRLQPVTAPRITRAIRFPDLIYALEWFLGFLWLFCVVYFVVVKIDSRVCIRITFYVDHKINIRINVFINVS